MVQRSDKGEAVRCGTIMWITHFTVFTKLTGCGGCSSREVAGLGEFFDCLSLPVVIRLISTVCHGQKVNRRVNPYLHIPSITLAVIEAVGRKWIYSGCWWLLEASSDTQIHIITARRRLTCVRQLEGGEKHPQRSDVRRGLNRAFLSLYNIIQGYVLTNQRTELRGENRVAL